MPERTSHPHGTPSWIDLSTTDPAQARSFYTGLFGWDARDQETPDGPPYTMLLKKGKAVAALSAMRPEESAMGVPPHWNTYMTVDDVKTAASAAQEAGGTVLMEPFDVMDAGKMAVVQDPTGAVFSLWQAGNHIGAELLGEPGALSWNELLTDDVEAAWAYYAKTLGWTSEVMDMPTGPYTICMVGDTSVAGIFPKTPEMGPPHWAAYIGIDDCDAAIARAKDLGGTVVVEPMDIPDVGRIAMLADPQGAMFWLMRAAEPGE